ncbi:hypothetical protein [Micrococcus luteus]|uniref:hypothetical protein n=1 Tax=Micrococcus luteus TaxID=1270 RepID=UPI003329D4F7
MIAITIRLDTASQVVSAGLVSTFIRPGRFIVLINRRSKVDRKILQELERRGGQALADLAATVHPGHPYAVRFFLERDIPGNQLIHIDADEGQADVYVDSRGGMTWELADELAAHFEALIPYIPPL